MLLLLRLFNILALLFLLFEMSMVIRFWVYARRMGVSMPMAKVAGMRMRNLKLKPIIDAYARVQYGSLAVSMGELIRLQQLGGDVAEVVDAMVKAKAAGEPLNFRDAANDHLAQAPAPVLNLVSRPKGKGEDPSRRHYLE